MTGTVLTSTSTRSSSNSSSRLSITGTVVFTSGQFRFTDWCFSHTARMPTFIATFDINAPVVTDENNLIRSKLEFFKTNVKTEADRVSAGSPTHLQ